MVEGLFGIKEVSRNSQNQIILPAEFREILIEENPKGRFYVYIEEERSLLVSTLDELIRDLRKGGKAGSSINDRNFITVFSKSLIRRVPTTKLDCSS